MAKGVWAEIRHRATECMSELSETLHVRRREDSRRARQVGDVTWVRCMRLAHQSVEKAESTDVSIGA
jgi:hypothetical protein